MQDNINQSNEHVYFINQLYRDFLLPEILGKDTASILYWAGKRIARHYNLASFEDLVDFFNNSEFGVLERVKQRRSSITFELSGQTVSDRLNSDSKEFSLEAGMIAEALQAENNRSTECEMKILDKEEKVQLTATFN